MGGDALISAVQCTVGKGEEQCKTYLFIVVRVGTASLDQAVKVALGLKDLLFRAVKLLHMVLSDRELYISIIACSSVPSLP